MRILVVALKMSPGLKLLAALSLRGHPSPATFVRQFTGNNRFIVDFLVEDVLSKQPDEVRRFLTRTSILPRFCAPLCDAITGSADAAAILELLERENLFLVPLDESREWFRYHHLFAQVLRAQLASTESAVVPVLHERASGWHRASGSPDEAIGHALAADDDVAPGVAASVGVRAVAAAATKVRILDASTDRGIDRCGVVIDVDHVHRAQATLLTRADVDGRATECRCLLDSRRRIADSGAPSGAADQVQ